MKKLLALTAAFASLAGASFAGPLTQAQVTKIINRVEVVDPAKGAHAAKLQETIKDQIELKTGVKSRSELQFQDNTLTRIGPETTFSFKAGTRDLTLEKGTMLLQVPKGLGGTKIRTAAITAAITGTTIMMEYTPGKNIKVLVLEGSLRLSVNGGILGDSVLLLPGRMVIMRPDAKRIPDPVAVDLRRVMKTSSLVKMAKTQGSDLPSEGLIEKEIDQQDHDRSKGALIETNLVINGHGTNVTMESDSAERRVQVALNQLVPAANPIATSTPPAADPAPTSTPAPSGIDPTPTPPPVGDPTPTPPPGTDPTPTPPPGTDPTPTPPPGTDPTPTPPPGTDPTPTPPPGTGPTPTPQPTGTPGPSEHNDEVPTASHLDIHGGDDDSHGPLVIDQPLNIFGTDRGGDVHISSEDTVTLASQIKVSQSSGPYRSRDGGTITVEGHKKNGTAIVVTDSAQLLSLLDAAAPGPGGKIQFIAKGGAIDINGAKMIADRGVIEIRNEGDGGPINVNQASLSASTIKIGALGKNGTLNIGGGTLSADTAIKLYAGGSNGTVNFTDNVTLNGTSVKTISGNTVTVFNGKVVTVNGPVPANVFTNHPNYSGWGGNSSTTGTFTGQGVITRPLKDGPGY
jgi:FecR protein